MKTSFCLGSLKGVDDLKDLDIDGKIIFNGSKINSVGRCRLDSSNQWQGPGAGCCEHENDASDSVRFGKCLV
jgi:hypothetical protein